MIKSRKVAILFVLPAIAWIIIVIAYPILFSTKLALSGWVLAKGPESNVFVGLKNFKMSFHDDRFLIALKNTFLYITLSFTFTFLVGLLTALLLSAIMKGHGIARTLVMLPMMICPVVAGLLWRYMYMARFGIINAILNLLRLPSLNWLGNPSIALVSVMIVQVWENAPLSTIILLAGLQGISQETLEAGKIDGGSRLQIFRYLTLPLLRPIIVISLLIQTIGASKIFDQIYVLTGGGPVLSTESLSTYVVRVGMSYTHIGQATAYALMMLIIMSPFIFLYVKSVLK